jgi:hypothetical protein
MISVIRYLPCLSPAQSRPSCLSSVCLVIVLLRLAPCPPPFSSALSAFSPLCCCARLQFTVCCSGFFLGGDQSAQGLCWFNLGVAREIPCDTWCSLLWSVECLAGLEPVEAAAAVLAALRFS